MDLSEKYYHWCWGENNIRPDRPHYLINMEEGISIRFSYPEAMFASFSEFYASVADVQFLSGHRPHKEEVEYHLIDAYNFLAIEERILEGDIEAIEEAEKREDI